jgi:hypothetical protein
MGYTSTLETCSAEVRRGVEWLKSNVDIDKVDAEDANIFYVLKEFDQESVEKYLGLAKDESFWDEAYYESLACWFLAKLGLSDNSFYVQKLLDVKDSQNREGRILHIPGRHCDVLRILVLLEPYSDYTSEAVHCLIDNLEEWDTYEIAIGVLALTELDYEQYQCVIDKGIDILFGYKKEDGGFEDVDSTSWIIQAISRIRGSQDFAVQEATNWLEQQQNDDGSWTHHMSYVSSEFKSRFNSRLTANALLALISVGKGPKIPLAEVEWKETLMNQRIERTKPHFVHTSPIFDQRMHVKDIYAKVKRMLNSAEAEIKILSPYMDVMYEDIVDLAKNNPDISIKLVTRPSRDIQGMRERIAKNVLDLLKIATSGNLRTNEILHSRMIIVDGKEALISSADLTRDQLIDEFNAGIWVRDIETIKRATDFFDNIWKQSEKKK